VTGSEPRSRAGDKGTLEVDFDHHSPAFAEGAEALLAEIRHRCPVAWTSRYGGYWLVTTSAGAHLVMRDDLVFSSGRNSYGGDGLGKAIPKFDPGILMIPGELDGPVHRPYMKLIAQLLSPSRAEALQPVARKWATHFLDQVIETGACDLMYDYAVPVPGAVALEWLGFPPDDWRPMAQTLHDFAGYAADTPQFASALAAFPRIFSRCQEQVEDRIRHPQEDATTEIATSQVAGIPMSEQDAVSIVFTLVLAGLDTTSSLVGSALVHLHRHTEDRRRLIEDPDLLDLATEEFLRLYPPATNSARTVMADTDVCGVQLHKGDRVLVSWVSANHDEDTFSDANRFVLDRFPNPHHSFGLGPHRCLGSHLARVVFKEMLTQALARIPDYVIADEQVVAYPSRAIATGWTTAPATFTPGSRLTTAKT